MRLELGNWTAPLFTIPSVPALPTSYSATLTEFLLVLQTKCICLRLESMVISGEWSVLPQGGSEPLTLSKKWRFSMRNFLTTSSSLSIMRWKWSPAFVLLNNRILDILTLLRRLCVLLFDSSICCFVAINTFDQI